MKLIKSVMFAFALLLMSEGAAHAQDAPRPPPSPPSLKPIGAGIVIIGASLGIGMLAKAAVESMARQPEIAGNIQTAMIIAAALIEGVTFFALLLQLSDLSEADTTAVGVSSSDGPAPPRGEAGSSSDSFFVRRSHDRAPHSREPIHAPQFNVR